MNTRRISSFEPVFVSPDGASLCYPLPKVESFIGQSSNSRGNPAKIFSVVFLVLLLVCRINAGETCVTDVRCRSDYGQMYVCDEGRCIRDNYSYSVREIAGFFFSMFVSIVTSTGGVGAGTMIVPTYMFFLQFNSADSVHLSRFSLFGGSLLYFLLNWKRRDPKHPDRLMINYNIASMMVPLHIAGAEFGVILGKFLPSIIVSILLISLLFTSLSKTYERAQQETNKERREDVRMEIEKGRTSTDPHNSTDVELNSTDNTLPTDIRESLSASEPQKTKDSQTQVNELDSEPVNPIFAQIIQNPSSVQTAQSVIHSGSTSKASLPGCPSASQELEIYTGAFATVKVSHMVSEHRGNFSLFVLASAVNILSTLIRGGDGRPSIIGLDACSDATWKVLFTSQIACVFLAFVGYSRNYDKMESESQETMTMLKDRVVRNKLIIASYVTGLAAGMAGVGGGMVLSIYMLSLGVDVGTAGSLSMFAVLFSASSTCIQSIMVGGIHLRHAYAILTVAFLGSLIGTLGLRRLLQTLNKPSLILWVLVVVLSIAAIVLPIQTVLATFKHPQVTFSVGSFC